MKYELIWSENFSKTTTLSELQKKADYFEIQEFDINDVAIECTKFFISKHDLMDFIDNNFHDEFECTADFNCFEVDSRDEMLNTWLFDHDTYEQYRNNNYCDDAYNKETS
jgi:hypothetical protein